MALAFVSRALAAEGALVEDLDDRALQALLPEPLRVELGLPDAPLLALDGRDGSVACGHGTELFQALVARALRGPPVAVAEARLAPPRPRDPDGYAGLNVALRPGAATPVSAWTLTAHLRVEAVADERRLARAACAVSLPDGCPIEPPAWDGVDLDELADLAGVADAPDDASLLRGQEALLRAAAARALEAVAPFRAHVARRLRRDLLRVEAYFAELDADLASRVERSRAPEALASKRAALPAERARRLENLREAAVLKVGVTPAALVLVRHPGLEAPLDVLRRKARRTITVRYHAGLRRWSPLACEGCGAATLAFGACDEAVHVLCGACLEAGGERQCPRCRRGAPPPAAVRLELEGVDEEVAAAARASSPVDVVGRAPRRAREAPPAAPAARSTSRPGAAPRAEAPPARTRPAADPSRRRALDDDARLRDLVLDTFSRGKEAAERLAERRAARARDGDPGSTKRAAAPSSPPPEDPRQGFLWTAGPTPAPAPAPPPAPKAEPQVCRPVAPAPAQRRAPRPPAAEGPVAEALAAVLKAVMSSREPLSAAEVAARAKVPAEVAREALAALVAHGAVQRSGRTKGTRYAWSGW